MRAPRSLLRLVRLTVLAAAWLAGGAAWAQSAPTCAFDAASGVLTVSVDRQVARLRAVPATGDILLNGASCAGATLTTTDSIQVVGGGLDDRVTLTGTFAPGRTAESDGVSVEVTIGNGLIDDASPAPSSTTWTSTWGTRPAGPASSRAAN